MELAKNQQEDNKNPDEYFREIDYWRVRVYSINNILWIKRQLRFQTIDTPHHFFQVNINAQSSKNIKQFYKLIAGGNDSNLETCITTLNIAKCAVKRVTIIQQQNNSYSAQIWIFNQQGDFLKMQNAEPGFATNVALRFDAPIFISKKSPCQITKQLMNVKWRDFLTIVAIYAVLIEKPKWILDKFRSNSARIYNFYKIPSDIESLNVYILLGQCTCYGFILRLFKGGLNCLRKLVFEKKLIK
eukprot:TRINITY_DN22859_c0_g1_i1.p2 TRINITY_DN22859_c0_g1~~TRINITY_DN22859_c0_g1_i1.p2  ORF type:complete len:243 (-),score=6.20 TRINITY_DN22859_c0_g1_i1:378-1106(-)